MINFVYGANPNDLVTKLNKNENYEVITILSSINGGYIAFFKVK